MNAFEWSEPVSIEQALAQGNVTVADAMVRKGGAPQPANVFKAGGVDLLDLLKEGIVTPSRVISLRMLPGLDQITEDAQAGLKIGPLVTLDQLDTHPGLRKNYTAVAEAAGHSATPQIRNAATIGGNVLQRPRCWYFRHHHFQCLKKGGDQCFALEGENQYHAIFGNKTCAMVHGSTAATALVAFDARIVLTGPKGTREMTLEEFFVTPEKDVTRENSLQAQELITEIRLPAVSANTRSAHIKQGEKESFDWPIADVAAVIEQSGGRCTRASIVLGAAAPVPMRAKAAEAALLGKPVNEETARAAAQAAIAEATPLSRNGYKVSVFAAVIRRTILRAVQPS